MKHLINIKKYLEIENIDAIILTSATNKFYTANLFSSSGYVFITKNSQYIIVDFRYYEEVKLQSKEYDVLLMDKDNTYLNIINKICKNENISTIGFEGNEVSFDLYEIIERNIECKFKSINLSKLRSIKNEEELIYIKKACEIADNTFNHIIHFIEIGMTEKEVENEIVRYIKEQGGQKESFDVIVASGKRGALPHGKASDKVIEEGDFVTFDFGAKYNNYSSDITRTICMGESSEELAKVYNIVKMANEEVIKVLKSGMTTGEVDQIARDIIEKEGYGEYFGHNLGHGVGIMVHEYPALAPGSQDILYEGMVVTVEPGIYLPNIGGVRIEDDVLITKDGCIRLTTSNKELMIVK